MSLGHVWNKGDKCCLCGTGRDWPGGLVACPIAALSLDTVAAVADNSPEGRRIKGERARARWAQRKAAAEKARGAA